MFEYNPSATDADNGGTIIRPSNGIGRWFRIFTGAIDLRWFGAKGDGVTDDRSAVVAALAAASTSPVKILFVSSGTYLFTSNTLVAIPAGVTLTGSGRASTIFLTSTCFGIQKWFTHGGGGIVERLTFKTNQTLDYTTLTNTGTFLWAIGDNVTVQDCHFENGSNDGFYFTGTHIRKITAVRNTFTNLVRGCVIGIGGDEVVISNNEINSPGYFGINIEVDSVNDYLGSIVIADNSILGARNPIQVVGEPSAGSNWNSSIATITGNVALISSIVGGTIAGIPFSLRVRRATLTGNSFTGVVYDKFVGVTSCQQFTMVGNTFEETSRTSNEAMVILTSTIAYLTGNCYKSSSGSSYALFFKLLTNCVVWAHDELCTFAGAINALPNSIDGTSKLLGSTAIETSLGGTTDHTISLLGAAQALGARVLLLGGDFRLDMQSNTTLFRQRSASVTFMTVNSTGKVSQMLTALPTVAGAAGELYNDSGTVKVSP